MKREVKTLATLGLSAVLALGTMTTSFAAGWTFDGPENWKWRYENEDGTRPVNQWLQINGKWYHFDADGYMDVGWRYIDGSWYYLNPDGDMAESGSWDGGFISSSGALVFDEFVGRDDDNLLYWSDSTQKWYHGTLPWKTQLFEAIIQAIDGNNSNGNYSVLDFQLPDNWQELCPKPLMSEILSCAITDSDTYVDNQSDTFDHTWRVDENNVIHITMAIDDDLPEDQIPGQLPPQSWWWRGL